MIYTEQTKRALKLCFKAHKHQTDKSGMPYVFHPFHLAEQMTNEVTTIVALLHDVAEDNCKYPLKKLRKMGFPSEAIDALRLLTHEESVPYMEYVAKIKQTRLLRWSSWRICGIIATLRAWSSQAKRTWLAWKSIARPSCCWKGRVNHDPAY